MTKEYAFDKNSFRVQVTVTGIFVMIIFMVCVYAMITNSPYGPLCALIAVVCVYTVWNSFVSLSNPEKVMIGDDFISFSAYGREHKYMFHEVEQFKIREFPSAGKMFIRINRSNVFKGRYWLQTKQIEDGRELFMRLLDMEYEMHPESLKALARRTNTEYNEIIKNNEKNQIVPKTKKRSKKTEI